MDPLKPKHLPSRLDSLTGMRFVFAAFVVACHLSPQIFGTAINTPLPHILGTFGPAGVSFFFILSGFIMTWVVAPNDTPMGFWRRRLVKIFPNHIVTFVATTILMILAGVPLMFINTIPVLFLFEPWIPNFDTLGGLTGINVSTWTLGVELFCYLSFPWLYRGLARIRTDRLWTYVGVVSATIFVIPFIGQLFPSRPLTSWDATIPMWHSFFAYSFPPVRMLEFILGILMARLVISGKWINLPFAPAVLLVCGTVTIQSFLPGVFRFSPFLTAVPLAFMITAAAVADITGARTFLRSKTVVWLGDISFALYIVHFIVIQYGPIDSVHTVGTLAPPAERLYQVVFTVVVSFALAAALYTFVERPMVQRFSRPKPKKTAEAPVTVNG